MMVTMLSVNLSACSGDDDDVSSIVGTWVWEENDSYGCYGSIAVFNADKSGTWTLYDKNKTDGSYKRYDTDPFTYAPTSSTEGTIAIEEKKGTEHLYYVIKGNELHIYQTYEESRENPEEHEVFIKQ